MTRTDAASREIGAPPDRVYEALVDPDALTVWLPPDGMSGSVDGVRNGIVFRKGKPYLRISAKHIQVNISTLDFTAVGKVHIERIDDPEKRSFDTDLVTWTNDAKVLRMAHPSYVRSGDQTLVITNITVNFDDDSIRLGKVSGGVELHR